MTIPAWDTLSIDIRHALRTVASLLADEFAGIYGRETIERFLYSSYDQLAPNATVTRFVPLFAERFARQRLRALAKVEGLHYDGKPTVLFLCTHNAGRSQMALGFFEALTGDHAVALSGGSEPGTRSTAPPSPRCLNEPSTSPASSPNPGLMRPSAPPTS